MKYVVDSTCGNEVKIKNIENGFLITYYETLDTKQVYVKSLEDLYKWLSEFYTEKSK